MVSAQRFLLVALFVSFFHVQARTACADAIIVTKAMTASTVAEIFIEEDGVRIDVEIGIADLDGFANLLPDELLIRMGRQPEPLQERLPRFFREDLTIRANDGPPLAGRVVSMEGRRRVRRDEVTGEPLPAADDAEVVIFVQPTQGLPREASGQILTSLLRNVYHAFDFREEDLIYDTLDHSVCGDLLAQIYLETRRGLELASQGGARVKVQEVEMLDVVPGKLNGGEGFKARCTWNVTGSVGHWGHMHKRTNQYKAELTVRPVEGRWKITDLELIEEQRIS